MILQEKWFKNSFHCFSPKNMLVCLWVYQHFYILHISASHPLCFNSWRTRAQLLEGDASQQRAPQKTTTNIKRVPLVEQDYQPLSEDSTSPPSAKASLTAHGEAREKRLIRNKLISLLPTPPPPHTPSAISPLVSFCLCFFRNDRMTMT